MRTTLDRNEVGVCNEKRQLSREGCNREELRRNEYAPIGRAIEQLCPVVNVRGNVSA